MTLLPVHHAPFSVLDQPSSGQVSVCGARHSGQSHRALRFFRLILLPQGEGAVVTLPIQCEAPSNFTLKLVRPGFGPAAELPALPQARWRHAGCRSRLGSPNIIRGNRRAAPASARETGRTA